jgi:hypothetical protein
LLKLSFTAKLTPWDRSEHDAILKITDYDYFADTHTQEMMEIDTVAGIKLNQSDDELIAQALVLFGEKTQHLTSEVRDELWALFLQHQACWIRPRSGQVKVMKISFDVRGPWFVAP